MKNIRVTISCFAIALLTACAGTKTNDSAVETMSSISQNTVQITIDSIIAHTPQVDAVMVERGVANAASFWKETDGTESEFTRFCIENFAVSPEERHAIFIKLSDNFELINGNMNRISIGFTMPLHVVGDPITPLDERFGALNPMAHISEDMFNSKIAFVTLLNFPFYTLEEKNTLGEKWSRKEWAYARMGDLFTSRIPADVAQNFSNATTAADNYISAYNITMGKLRNPKGEQLFADDMTLITHWGLRDELKSNYSNADGRGLEKQRMIYRIMLHIINQTIPQDIISSDKYIWYPIDNKVFENDKEINFSPEPNTRYQIFFNTYKTAIAEDKYCPVYPTALKRNFDQLMEVSDKEIEDMFVSFISSPEVIEVSKLITLRLGRNLEPFDIWYDGFKSRSTINEDELSAKTRVLYPNAKTVEARLPNIMVKLGFTPEKAKEVCAKIRVDASRGAGHAWGAMSRDDVSRLRTRIADNGMDYKGYNIAVHEFGHNVEQTISINDVDYYTMGTVPSTAFTEALAFIFQKRDLELLGYKDDDSKKSALKALDIFWGCYENMGVSLVDIYTWRWLYEHPEATVESLKDAIISNAITVWNKYYAPIFGVEDSPILAIYSHMICSPLYLSNYPYGNIVESQIEVEIAGKNLGDEILRIYKAGRLTPNLWMEHAAGTPVSIEPLLKSVREALNMKNIQ
jgi:hypothetical protein